MKLTVPRHDIGRFTWDGNKGCAEASDFNFPIELYGRMYDDACDVGFEVISSATGVVKTFVFAAEARNAENEVVGWVYSALGPMKLTITVLND